MALDSADAWANPGLFQLDKDNIPAAVAGVPPDGFSPTGQLWGNPLYCWETHRATGYQWWITRLWYCFELYDVVRIDHFRGFDEYFSIPYGSETAVDGHWEKGPGIELFRAVEQALGKREIIAEDLGYMSDTVRQLVRDSGFPGMKVLEFAFDSRDTGSASDYLPHNYPVNSVAYTGTHDNETLVSWYQTISDAERAMVRDYLYDYATPDEQLYKSMIALILRSAAARCIISMQDWLGLDNAARINKPSTVGQNWRWRLKKTQLTKKLQKEISGAHSFGMKKARSRIRIFKGSLYDFSCVGLLVGTRRKKLDFKHFLSRKTGVQLFGSSDWLYSRFFFLLSSNYFNTVLLCEQGYKLYLR